MAYSVPSRSARVQPRPVARAAALLILGGALTGAHATVTYLPYCGVCSLDSTPAAGDEWVIQGGSVSFSADHLLSAGVLTNNASTLTSAHDLQVQGGFNNNRRFNNTGSLLVAGFAQPTFTNFGTFSNTGTVTVYTTVANKAGRLINTGAFKLDQGELTNHGGATLTNYGDFAASNGRLHNLQGGTVTNLGTLGGFGSSLRNEGTFNNRAGAVASVSQLQNAGRLVNYSGATLNVGQTLVNYEGSKLVNRGTLNVGIDSLLVMSKGSDYDFSGGTLNLNDQGRWHLERDFTIGDARGGSVKLNAGSRLINSGTLRIKGQQTTSGDVENTSLIINSGTWESQGHISNRAQISNQGVLVQKGLMTGGALSQTGGKTVIAGETYVDTVNIGKGTLEVATGGRLNAATLHTDGGVKLTGGESSVGTFSLGERGWLATGSDTLRIQGSFTDASLVVDQWNTAGATLAFEGAGLHKLGVGASSHSWYQLTLDGAGSYEFFDGNGAAAGGDQFMVRLFSINNGDLSLLQSITSDANIYYDPTLAGNAYLGGLNYHFGQGSGQLLALAPEPLMAAAGMVSAPVPEPEQWALGLAGALVVGACRRRSSALATKV